MPTLETPEELADALADLCGIYNQGMRLVGLTPEESRNVEHWGLCRDHADDCWCRACWRGRMERRIRSAVLHEQLLQRAYEADHGSLEQLLMQHRRCTHGSERGEEDVSSPLSAI